MNREQLRKLARDLWAAADKLRANSDLKAVGALLFFGEVRAEPLVLHLLRGLSSRRIQDEVQFEPLIAQAML